MLTHYGKHDCNANHFFLATDLRGEGEAQHLNSETYKQVIPFICFPLQCNVSCSAFANIPSVYFDVQFVKHSIAYKIVILCISQNLQFLVNFYYFTKHQMVVLCVCQYSCFGLQFLTVLQTKQFNQIPSHILLYYTILFNCLEIRHELQESRCFTKNQILFPQTLIQSSSLVFCC